MKKKNFKIIKKRIYAKIKKIKRKRLKKTYKYDK